MEPVLGTKVKHAYGYIDQLHTSIAPIKSGFFDDMDLLQGKEKLADLQNKGRTFYAGSSLAFELVETTMKYSEDLVKRFFPLVGLNANEEALASNNSLRNRLRKLFNCS